MNLKFVNHSSVIYDYGEVKLIADPWIEGDVFQEGWRHIAETKFTYEDFAGITHIWFSHEHPDHFFPVNIKKIPENYRSRITILYQQTEDKKVVEFCKKLQFKDVIELKPSTWLNVADNFSVMCNSLWGDSWLAVKTDRFTVLNTNDCYIYIPEVAQPIKKLVGDIDVLLTQFSYAQYEGNKLQKLKRTEAARRKLDQVDTQISVFRPKFLIPFASFVWFCHEENYFNNDVINTIWDVENYYLNTNTTPIILFPGDEWQVGNKKENKEAIERWREKYKLIELPERLNRTVSVNLQEVIENGNHFLKKIKEKGYSKMIKRNSRLSIYLNDLDKFLVLSKEILQEVPANKEPDCIITSETLNFCFKFDWGFNTTHVNARVQFLSDNAFKNFLQFEEAASFMNQNLKPPSALRQFFSRIRAIIKK